MKVYRSLEDFSRLNNAVVTQGTFDGVHLGHQKILRRLKAIAEADKGETVLLTFFPHPRMVLQPDDNKLRLLQTVDEKIARLEKEGIGHLIVIPFTHEFSRQNAEDFVKEVLVEKIGTKVLVIGYDHRFGKNREGSLHNLISLSPVYDFRVEEIPEEDINAVAVSSTKIRNALLSGDLATANAYLGYHYIVSGRVVPGNRKGKELGFPTANIAVQESYKLIPSDGVYAVHVNVKGKKYGGMANIGNQPTFTERQHAFEVHLFDFDGDLYGEDVSVEFISRLRDERRFNSIEDLKKQLELDRFAAKGVIESLAE